MKINERTVIEGDRVYLVPYEEHHVKKYHEWMKSAELQTLTASEPLSLEEEYKMQKSWREDNDKCTFIILCKSKYDETKDEIQAMIGDTNIFLKYEDNVAEIEIMIAEKDARGKGLGKEAVLMMLRYGIFQLKITTYRAIILQDNIRSIILFDKLGFQKVLENKVFNEIILEKKVCEKWTEWIKSKTPNYKEKLR
ncbi:UNVERIFIED_CONTAM: hypothetical protein PYX00_005173 [Menopon gallinae]|uniref:N-acetyltransferase domain-containing protein n=1 Tax=Menopon gallinae TaxID=328185 RepID=A0AAW2HR12_9NEOP